MFLRGCKRIKDGKEHLYWSIVENRRLSDGRVAQRHVLYLGELNSTQETSWQKTIELLDPEKPMVEQVALFPEDRAPDPIDVSDVPIVRLRLDQLRLERPRQWGACWLATQLWEQLGLGSFWSPKLPPSREGTRWDLVLQTLVFYRLIDPGSEWRLHRHWFDHTALSDLIGGDFSLAEIHRLYECHDQLLEHKTALFDHLTQRWKTLFNAQYDVLLYDCVLRGKSDSDSNSFRTVMPMEIGHRFRGKSDSDSDLKSDSFPGSRNGVRNESDYSQEELERRWISRHRWSFFTTKKATNGTTTQIHASDQRNPSTQKRA